ncbi:hypothetical protein [Nocardioides sp. SYSU DS0663]|uniref:hypothetical protein n=1 Tax=Nocardioides sp. SYSU DS0663 TaxID=3416445 RepID=UPI003F4C5D4F
MPFAVRTLLASAALTGGAVAVGVAAVEPAPPPAEPPPAAEPDGAGSVSVPRLSEVETRGLAVLRAPFCDGVPAEAVLAALGRPPRTTDTWENGETAPLTPTTTDVAHEHGCRWSSGPMTAAAWVFAPPVTAARAEALGRAAMRRGGCEPVADAPAFGEPSTALLCRSGRRAEVSFRGLLGDAWLVCSLGGRAAGDADALLARADQWCGAVVTAATGAAPPG